MKLYGNPLKKHRKSVKAAVFAVVLTLMLLCRAAMPAAVFAASPDAEGWEGEWDIFETELPAGTAGAEASATLEAEVTPTPDPDATPVPTYNGDKILFEPGESGSNNTSSAGSIIMIIIVVLAILSIVSGIVEKIVKYYKNRDKEFKVD